MVDKAVIMEMAITDFLDFAEERGWGIEPLCYVYNKISQAEDLKDEEFVYQLTHGGVTLAEFFALLFAVKGSVSFRRPN